MNRDGDQVGLKAQILAVATAAAVFSGAAPAGAQLTPALVTTPSLPSTPAVDAFYAARANVPIWFRDVSSLAAARLLPAILERASLDGLDNGPDLARQVDAALARVEAFVPPAAATPTARPAAILAEDKLLSAAWVQYVRSLKAPVPGIAYGDPALAPQVPKPDRILIDAARAPSLPGHVRAVAAVNPIYAHLRDAAWSQMQSGGGLAADPRLLTNLQRARILPSSGRYIIVNAATARLSMFEDGRQVDTMKVVVGKPATPTPMLAGTIHYATLNPYWNIPTDVAARVVAPVVVKRGVSYLRSARYELASDWTPKATALDPATVDWKAVAAGTTTVHLRQLPGPANMMGALKFGFVNDQGIYLHDTPHKELFAKARRNFSLGCVRVEDAQRLGAWLLGREPVAPSAEPEHSVQLAKGVPVYITYLTALPADDGQLAFADDVYGRDPKTEAGLAEVKLATIPSRIPAAIPESIAAITPH